ncbi:hypothetical protein VIAQ111709_19415 [Vibrio aquimaris]|uniref:Uncharacterized protein n=1 Tax=Vibrio aquimaris TaxID=2587862 RepID=A0A5P9CR92_9VIBR|nr:hypothetical protein FIV01_18145 [Vibrio aquimaris]
MNDFIHKNTENTECKISNHESDNFSNEENKIFSDKEDLDWSIDNDYLNVYENIDTLFDDSGYIYHNDFDY